MTIVYQQIIKKQIEVLTAIKEGIPVEYQGKRELNAWRPLKNELGKCNFADLEYRIVEEPKTPEEEIIEFCKKRFDQKEYAFFASLMIETLNFADKRYKKVDDK